MYGGAPYGSLSYGSTFGGVVIMPEICDVTDWAIQVISAASWGNETVLSSTWTSETEPTSTWTTICDGDAGTIT